MTDKRVTFQIDGMRLADAGGNLMWEHRGQVWHNLPQAGAVWLQGKLVELEAQLVQMGEIAAQGGTVEEQFAKAAAAGLMPGKRSK